MRNTFDTELQDLSLEMISMASTAEQAIGLVTRALAGRDPEGAREAIQLTRGMEEQERTTENHCLRLLLQQQPVARDLRTISTALKMVTDLQRIGGQAANIAELAILLARQETQASLADIRLMAQKAGAMVKRAIFSYANRDVSAAKGVIALDDEVDGLFEKVKDELVELILSNHAAADQAIDLIIIAKYLERIADHSVNIAQWAIFSVTGEL